MSICTDFKSIYAHVLHEFSGICLWAIRWTRTCSGQRQSKISFVLRNFARTEAWSKLGVENHFATFQWGVYANVIWSDISSPSLIDFPWLLFFRQGYSRLPSELFVIMFSHYFLRMFDEKQLNFDQFLSKSAVLGWIFVTFFLRNVRTNYAQICVKSVISFQFSNFFREETQNG